MSQGDSVTGGTGTTDTSGLDQTFSDASLGDQFMGGSGDIFGGDATAAGGAHHQQRVALTQPAFVDDPVPGRDVGDR